MKYIKKFESFIKEEAEPATAPTPATKPRPETKPGERPNPQRPSPIRRTRPSVSPAPKANLKKATELDVVNRFMQELGKSGESVKNYVK